MGSVLFFSILGLVFILSLLVIYWGIKNLFSFFMQSMNANQEDLLENLRKEIKSIKHRLDQLEKRNE
ncbi:putative PurR-regulated permease PerM [Scopulibacillus daqui]|uniref:PurR-regulated permease PerM n=1 Tax=Scopulibacillus daqui TaxID=1469162 RepID=A0ABS2Q3A3_9BACL|nr:hypothetical protein [Scopulibacillus daqui]MBM7646783.1 putative PurR-regulated permease PerM [Scopulibacillus daqui]